MSAPRTLGEALLALTDAPRTDPKDVSWREGELGRETLHVAGRPVGCVYPTLGDFRAMLFGHGGAGQLYPDRKTARARLLRAHERLVAAKKIAAKAGGAK